MIRKLGAGAVAAIVALQMQAALAQQPSNGPVTGIPSGLGRNGSETFTPAPAMSGAGLNATAVLPQVGQPVGGVRKPVTGAHPSGKP